MAKTIPPTNVQQGQEAPYLPAVAHDMLAVASSLHLLQAYLRERAAADPSHIVEHQQRVIDDCATRVFKAAGQIGQAAELAGD